MNFYVSSKPHDFLVDVTQRSTSTTYICCKITHKKIHMYKNFSFLPSLTLNRFSRNQFSVRNNIFANFLQQATFMLDNPIDVAGTNVPVTALQTNINVASVLEFKPFKDWVSDISK